MFNIVYNTVGLYWQVYDADIDVMAIGYEYKIGALQDKS